LIVLNRSIHSNTIAKATQAIYQGSTVSLIGCFLHLPSLALRASFRECRQQPWLISPCLKSGALRQLPVKITVDSDSNGAALFDLYSGQDLLTVNAIAWTKEGAAAVWDMFETLYLKLSGQMGVFMRSPSQPQTLPWLATIVLPSEQLVNWMADFEQCLAIALIKQCDRKSKTKGFGK
jgi:hypothetical protein